jgi:predicted SnoaL-like aldol condensation-catalyzing enzyme
MSPKHTLRFVLAVAVLAGCEEDKATSPHSPEQRMPPDHPSANNLVPSDLSTQPAVAVARTERNKAIVRRVVEQLFNAGNLVVADDLFAPTWIDHNPGVPALPPGPAGAKILVTGLRTAFPDLRLTVEDMIAEGDRVADRFTVRGTHLGSLNGIPPTGRKVAFTGSAFHRVVDGKLVESWANLDDLGLLRQLGVVP